LGNKVDGLLNTEYPIRAGRFYATDKKGELEDVSPLLIREDTVGHLIMTELGRTILVFTDQSSNVPGRLICARHVLEK